MLIERLAILGLFLAAGAAVLFQSQVALLVLCPIGLFLGGRILHRGFRTKRPKSEKSDLV